MPKVSVIIPIYNTEKYLSQCLESICSQTLKEIEIICINDGSTDSSSEILKNFASKDSRIIIINQQNSGQGAARNLGISKAKGEFTLCMDSDDWLEPQGLEKAYNKIKSDNADILIFDFYKFYENTQTKIIFKNTSVYNQLKTPFSPKEAGKVLLLNNSLCFKLYRTEFLKNNNIIYSNNKFMEDAPFYIKAMLLANKITCLDEALSNYRIYAKSHTFFYKNYLTCMPEIFDICFGLIKDFEEEKDILDSFLENRKRTLLYFYKITPFINKIEYYKMMQGIIKKHFLKYNLDKELEDICKNNFCRYELTNRIKKTIIVLKTYAGS